MERKMAVVFIAALAVWGCSVKEENVIFNGVSVNLAIKGLEHITKSVNEYSIADVNIYVVNSGGEVYSHSYSSSVSGISVEVPHNVTCTIYALANLGNSLPLRSADEIISMKLSKEYIEGNRMVMQGEYGPDLFSDGDNITLYLERIAAKISVKFDFLQLDDDVSVQINRVTLKNVPQSTSPFGVNKAESVADVADGMPIYYPTDYQLSSGIVFYMLENMQGTLHPGNSVQKMKVWPVGSLYSYICTYLEVQAYYSSDEKEGDIVYRYYLGKNPYSNYDIERNTQYNVNLIFKGRGGVDENSWRVDVGELEDVIDPYVEFGLSGKDMYDLEVVQIPFTLVQGKGDLQVSVSDPAVLEVVEFDKEHVKVRALSPGKSYITASISGASAQCCIDVHKLAIVPRKQSLDLYNHFYEDVEYDIYPPHAAGLEVGLYTSNTGISVGYDGNCNRIMPQFTKDVPLPLKEWLTLGIKGREDVSVQLPVNVHPMLSMSQSIIANANLGSTASVADLKVETSPRAIVDYSWAPDDGISIFGDPGKYIELDKEKGEVSLPVPNAANGTYRLVASVIGDDGYGTIPQLHTDAVGYCDITVYETVYLVGVSKTMSIERVSADPQIWKYSNEVVAKWLSHPKSLLFPNGEVPVDYGFVYKGQTYTDSHTEFHEDYTFTFIKGEPVYYALESEPRFFNGSIPQYYIEYFYLQPAVSPYIKGNRREGSKYLYINSLQFASGFSDENSPEWNKIFDFIYK